MTTLARIIRFPLWLAALFTSAKSFTANPLIGSRLLNRMGLYIARVMVARAITQLRWWTLWPLTNRERRQAFHKEGFVMLEGFLPTQAFKELKQEIDRAEGEIRECIQGDTLTHRILLDQDTLNDLPACAALTRNREFLHLLKYCAATYTRPHLYLQKIKNGEVSSGEDPQKNLHSDTFHPTMKAWLFLQDVTTDMGPLTYIPGSHRLTWARIKWMYKKSIRVLDENDGYSEKGSLRITEADRKSMQLNEPRAFTVKANTLIVANTLGFHCRGASQPNTSRMEIWAYSRTNPFNPLTNTDFAYFRNMETRTIRRLWMKKDQTAQARGQQSSWHPIAAKNLKDS